MKELCLEKMVTMGDTSRIEKLHKQRERMSNMKFYDLLHLSRIHFGESNTHINEFFEKIDH